MPTFYASFDIGFRTFTSCLVRLGDQTEKDQKDQVQILHWCKKRFSCAPWPARPKNQPRPQNLSQLLNEQAGSAEHTTGFLREFLEYVGLLFADWATLLEGHDVHRLLIEKQLRKNPKALFIQRKLRAFIGIANQGLVPNVSFVVRTVALVPAVIKYALFDPVDRAKIQRGRNGYKARKQAAIAVARKCVPPGTFVDADLSDSLVQLLADIKARAARKKPQKRSAPKKKAQIKTI